MMAFTKINTSLKAHAILALILGFWLVLFLVFIAPFDTADLSFKLRLLLLPPYGVIFIGSYLVAIVFQNKMLTLLKKWNLGLEIAVIGLTYILVLIFTYAYYKTPIINGTYDFVTFLSVVFLPILVIISTLLFFGRWYLVKNVNKAKEKKVIVKGQSKLDFLQVLESDIVYISSAQNYIEVHYMQQEKVKVQVVRKTLKEIHKELPTMIQTHRSYLINPSRFVKWKGGQHVMVGEKKIPVSKKYKSLLQSHFHSSQKEIL